MTQASAAISPDLTIRDLLALPPSVDVGTASRALGISRSHGYNLAHADEFPCRVVRAGRLFRVVTTDLLRVLGVSDEVAAVNETAKAA